ncbi:transmembrane protein 231-like [Corticium candelabrum]|uniref:transmembrane protein 231-like n=1 Tax=Corticium candelabrum TaxID=121492 RepID=UPI002E35DA68|nr:transmembrane protein 231-like [Corticium candelabrum]
MALLTVFTDNVIRQYRTSIVSKGLLFQLVVFVTTIVVPFFVAYSSRGFWMREGTYREQADVTFRREVVLTLSGYQRTRIFFSSFSSFNHLLSDQLRVPLIRSREEDSNFDGLSDVLHFSLEMPLLPNDEVVSVQLLLFFDYRLKKYSELTLQGMIIMDESTPIQSAKFHFSGRLRLRQSGPLPASGQVNTYNVHAINTTSSFAQDYDITSIVTNYESRNDTIYLDLASHVWKKGQSPNGKFIIVGTVYYPEQTISFRPGFWEVIKQAWIQYLAILVIFVFVFRYIKLFVFQNQVINTTVTSPKLT